MIQEPKDKAIQSLQNAVQDYAAWIYKIKSEKKLSEEAKSKAIDLSGKLTALHMEIIDLMSDVDPRLRRPEPTDSRSALLDVLNSQPGDEEPKIMGGYSR